jgi:hypothetical protein
MPTLHIEHPITDYPTWKAAFDRFSDVRAESGVRSFVVRQPVDDEHYVSVDLDFETIEQADGFLVFLREQVWSSPRSAPALAGSPVAVVQRVMASSGDDR